MMVRAKFIRISVTKGRGWGTIEFVYDAEFQAVYDSTVVENRDFFAATPSGSIKLSTIREDHFQVGLDYYVDFTPLNLKAAA